MISPKFAMQRTANGFDLPGFLGFQATGLSIFALNGFVHLLTMHTDLDGCGDTQSDLITSNVHHGDHNVITDDDTFVAVT
jgi:hypothetical protein